MAETENTAPETTLAAIPPPDVSAPVPGDISAVAPTSQPTKMGSAEGQGYQSAVAGQAAAAKNIQDLEKPTPPPAPVPHARLLAMISGLATGLGAASTSLATGGREGGAKEVQQEQAAAQQQKIQAQQAVEAQKNAKIQQQIVAFDTNGKLANSYMNLMTLPNEIEKSDLEIKGLRTGQEIETANFAASHGGMDAKSFNDALSNKNPVGRGNAGSFFTTQAKQSLDAATKTLGPNDPFVQNLQATLANPNATAADVWFAKGQLESQKGYQKEVTEEQTKKEAADANSPVGKLSTPEALAMPGSVQAIKEKIGDPNTNPLDVPRLRALIPLAQKAQTAKLDQERKIKEMEQEVANGDPKVIGSALASGIFAPSQVLSARSMSKPFYSKVTAEADAAAKAGGAPEIMGPNGEHTGHYYNPAKAEAQYQYAKNIQTQNTLNKIVTLNEPGGDLDILKDAAAALPKLPVKVVNGIFNTAATELGSPEATNYHMALYNFASLMAQVQTGGVPTEGEIQQQLTLLHDSYSKGQLDGGIKIARRDIGARGRSMVQGNPFLQNQYPGILQSSQDQHKVGDQVKLKDGQMVVIKSIDPTTGKFTY